MGDRKWFVKSNKDGGAYIMEMIDKFGKCAVACYLTKEDADMIVTLKAENARLREALDEMPDIVRDAYYEGHRTGVDWQKDYCRLDVDGTWELSIAKQALKGGSDGDKG